MTFSQLVRKGRQKQKESLAGRRVLDGCPQKKGVCMKIYIQKPKKPNSAQRKVARVRFTSGFIRTVYLRGEKHKLQENSTVLVEKRRKKDLPGVGFHVIPGVLDSSLEAPRMNGRSKYGIKKPAAKPTVKPADKSAAKSTAKPAARKK